VAVTHLDRLRKGLDLLGVGLAPFVDKHMAAAAPAGRDWSELLAVREEQRTGRRTSVSKNDPQTLLRCLTEDWRAFGQSLSRTDQSFATELRELRNRVAHPDDRKPVSADDTYRALDTMERLLLDVGAVAQADEVRRERVDHQRATYEAQARRTAKTATATAGVDGLGLKPWREVVRPHPDVASGQFNAAEFAANLAMVVRGEGSEEYLDPIAFFRRTYLTEGLRDLLARAARRVGGDSSASPSVNLQTTFGGGKTHSMLALFHLFGGTPLDRMPEDVQQVVRAAGITALPGGVRRVVLVGNHISPSEPWTAPDGSPVRTLWGQLAWQLGGAPAFAKVAAADRDGTNPGAALGEVLRAHSPAVILIDEWVAYARQLVGRDDLPAGSFETQFTFAQALSETVKATPGVLLVVSIPASDEGDSGYGGTSGCDTEVGGPNGRLALERLQNVVRREADPWRPASVGESFEIVRRRLFEDPDAAASADIAAVAKAFRSFYFEHRDALPTGVADAEYEARVRASYPLHPELFDRLYEDWSSLERFQRTRGVLRLMSNVIHVLWERGDAGPLIMPGSVPLDDTNVRSELAQYLDDSWSAVLDADVDGPDATPLLLDRDRPLFGARSLTRRLARAIFVGSAATLQGVRKGLDQQRVWLGVAVPGDTLGNFASALHTLGDRSTFLYAEGGRYWYDTQPGLGRMAKDAADRLREHPEDVWLELETRLRTMGARGPFAGVHPTVREAADVPDDPDVRLVLVHPSRCHSKGSSDSPVMTFAREVLERRGTAQRVHRNAVVLLAADSKRLEEVEEAAREFLAWKGIVARARELNLAPAQQDLATSRRDQADSTVRMRMPQAWQWVLLPVQADAAAPPVVAAQLVSGSEPTLAERVGSKLGSSGQLYTSLRGGGLGAELRTHLLQHWKKTGHLSVGEIWGLCTRYPYMPRLRDRAVLDHAVTTMLDEGLDWERDGFAVASGWSEADGYTGLLLPGYAGGGTLGQVLDTTLLVLPDVAVRADADGKRRAAAGDARPAPAESQSGGSGFGGQDGGAATVTLPARPTRFHGAVAIDPERYSRDLNQIVSAVIAQLAVVDGVELDVTVEISAIAPDGFDEAKIRTVSENARTLKFTSHGFEPR